MVNLTEHAHKRPGKLSGGQQQRVAIARALALDPPLILADEPTAHLDYIQVEGVLDILRRLADADRTVVIATHDDRLLPLADSIVELTPRHMPMTGAVEQISLEDGEVLFNQGDSGSLVYEVESGCIQIDRLRDDGEVEILSHVTPGSYFGELAPMFGLPRSATARSVGATVVNGVPVGQFRGRLRLRTGDRATEADAVIAGDGVPGAGGATVEDGAGAGGLASGDDRATEVAGETVSTDGG
jgi:putative ABC transport system ATP-binding protein